jgi:hypothetical protein
MPIDKTLLYKPYGVKHQKTPPINQKKNNEPRRALLFLYKRKMFKDMFT